MTITSGRILSVEPPDDLQQFLLEEGGRNPYGEPMFRLVWGGSRLAWRHGAWEDKDETGVLLRTVVEPRKVPKYGYAKERFLIEVWQPAEYYGTPTEWLMNTLSLENGIACSVLGEYPARGDYEQIDVIEQLGICECGKVTNGACLTCKKSSSYMMPSREYLAFFIRAYRTSVDKANRAANAVALAARMEKNEKDRVKYYEDRTRDALPAFDGAQHVVVPGTGNGGGEIVN